MTHNAEVWLALLVLAGIIAIPAAVKYASLIREGFTTWRNAVKEWGWWWMKL